MDANRLPINDLSLPRNNMWRGKTILEHLTELTIFEPNTGCWLWGGCVSKIGYGRIGFSGKTRYTHRISYAIHKGDPKKLCVCHTCDNRLCINPDHLFLGTHKDNTMDMISKGRDVHICGSDHTNSKLIDSDIQEIRALCKAGVKQRDIAKKFKINQCHVSDIFLRKRWKHLQ